MRWSRQCIVGVGAVLVASLGACQQEVFSMESGDSTELYHNAVHILESLPKINTNYQTHYYNHGPSAPAQVIDYLSDQLQDYFDIKLLITGPKQRDPAAHAQSDPKRLEDLDHAVRILEKSAKLGNPDALLLLGDMHFFGNYSTRRDFKRGFEHYQQLADLGNATAQFMVGLCHSTGVFGNLPIDQAKATLYYTFAAEGGDTRAQMAMGYRNMKGIAAATNYERAAYWYEKSAETSNEYMQDGPVPYCTRTLSSSWWVLPDEFMGGVYGQGSSEVSSGPNLKSGLAFKNNEQAIEYYQYAADENNDVVDLYHLARAYLIGGRINGPNYKKAVEAAERCATQVWPGGTEGPVRPAAQEVKLVGGICASFLGTRYLKGEGVPQDFNKAAGWFKRGESVGSPSSANELGMMLYTGVIEQENGREDGIKRIEQSARPEKSSVAKWYLSQIRIDQGKLDEAGELIKSAARSGVSAAWYQYGAIRAADKGFEEAATYFKQLSEQVDEFHSPLKWAHEVYRNGDVNSALLGFLIGAEQGYLSAQLNVAFLLDDTPSLIDLRHRDGQRFNSSETALLYYTRAGKQASMDAQVKMGDYYLNGVGTEQDAEKAVACYDEAADRFNGLGIARWNLGWMYETGTGVEKDFHMAKRYYDLAMESGSEAYLPVKLSLMRLYLKSWYNRMSGGNAKSYIEPEAREKLSIQEQWAKFWKQWREWKVPMWEEFDTDNDAYAAELDEESLYESIIVVGLMLGVCAFFVWYRRRQLMNQQNQQQNRQRNDNNNNNQQQPLNRPFGANLGHPDEAAIPPLYQ